MRLPLSSLAAAKLTLAAVVCLQSYSPSLPLPLSLSLPSMPDLRFAWLAFSAANSASYPLYSRCTAAVPPLYSFQAAHRFPSQSQSPLIPRILTSLHFSPLLHCTTATLVLSLHPSIIPLLPHHCGTSVCHITLPSTSMTPCSSALFNTLYYSSLVN